MIWSSGPLPYLTDWDPTPCTSFSFYTSVCDYFSFLMSFTISFFKTLLVLVYLYNDFPVSGNRSADGKAWLMAPCGLFQANCRAIMGWLKNSSNKSYLASPVAKNARMYRFFSCTVLTWRDGCLSSFYAISVHHTPTVPTPPLSLCTQGIIVSPWGWIGNEESRSRPVGKSQT